MEAKRLEGAVYRSGEEIFRQLFRQYGPTVYSHLLERCGNPQVARSLLKDIFAEVYQDIMEASTVDVTAIWLKSLANERLARLRAGGDVVKLATARVMQQRTLEAQWPPMQYQPVQHQQPQYQPAQHQPAQQHQPQHQPAQQQPAQYQQVQYQQAQYQPAQHQTTQYQPAQLVVQPVHMPPVQPVQQAQQPGRGDYQSPSIKAQQAQQPGRGDYQSPAIKAQQAQQPGKGDYQSPAIKAQQAQQPGRDDYQSPAVEAQQAAGPGQPIPGLIRPAGAAFEPYIPTGKQQKEKKRNRGRIALIVVLSIMIVFTMWMLAGLLMEVQVLPKMDWGYTWFNTHIFQLF